MAILLVVDLSDLELPFGSADIRLEVEADSNREAGSAEEAGLTVGELIEQLCDGIEQIGTTDKLDRRGLCLLDPNQKPFRLDAPVAQLALTDWDRIYLVRRN